MTNITVDSILESALTDKDITPDDGVFLLKQTHEWEFLGGVAIMGLALSDISAKNFACTVFRLKLFLNQLTPISSFSNCKNR